jgi:hypothetical protein
MDVHSCTSSVDAMTSTPMSIAPCHASQWSDIRPTRYPIHSIYRAGAVVRHLQPCLLVTCIDHGPARVVGPVFVPSRCSHYPSNIHRDFAEPVESVRCSITGSKVPELVSSQPLIPYLIHLVPILEVELLGVVEPGEPLRIRGQLLCVVPQDPSDLASIHLARRVAPCGCSVTLRF